MHDGETRGIDSHAFGMGGTNEPVQPQTMLGTKADQIIEWSTDRSDRAIAGWCGMCMCVPDQLCSLAERAGGPASVCVCVWGGGAG